MRAIMMGKQHDTDKHGTHRSLLLLGRDRIPGHMGSGGEHRGPTLSQGA